MIYLWSCIIVDKLIEVERKMKDSDVPPTKQEMLDAGWSLKEATGEHEWIKVITGGSATITFGQKGHWIILLGMLL